jgi:hypothetical protein
LALAALARGQGSLVSGLEFQVNDFTTGDQKGVAVANVGASCNFVAVWSSDGQDGSDTAVVGRLFDAAGNPAGGDFVVNVATTGAQQLPSVGSNPAGQFVVTWTDGALGNPATYEVRARRFDAAGVPQGGEIPVNAFTTGQQSGSSVALDTAGNFVVVWASAGQDGDGLGVVGRRFDSNGNPLAGDFQVNEFTTGDQSQPRIAMNPTGELVVVWQGGPDADAGAVMARRYDAAGAPLGGEFRVNTTETGAQHEPDVALDPVGRAIVAWTSDGQDGDAEGIYYQRLDASGAKLGPEINVNPYTTGSSRHARVAAGFGSLEPGEFAIVWDGPPEVDVTGVFAQTFFPDGKRARFASQVNAFTTGLQQFPAIAAQPNGQFVVTWESEAQDDSGFAVEAELSGVPRAEVTRVDVAHGARSMPSTSNLNGVLEVGETVSVEPSYRNYTTADLPLVGGASLVNPPAGLTYDVSDPVADYGTLAPGGASDCFSATGDCYELSITGTRPPGHIDALFIEGLFDFERLAAMHIGGTFGDVAPGNLFYPFVENLIHNGVTGGCAAGTYCPFNNVTRAQMAAFLLRARWGNVYLPPPATGTVFPDVPASNQFARWIEELAREGVTGGCGGGLYCPDSSVTRQQMAVFLLKTLEGSSYDPPDCTGVFPDVPCTPGTGFADWIEDLASRGITGGCAGGGYCPTNSVLRQQMAAFLVKTFGLQLY